MASFEWPPKIGGVSSINGISGDIILIGAGGITITPNLPVPGSITITGTGGTVTGLSVATLNGFAGTVATPTTTPVITLSTTLNTPVIAGNGTALIPATTTGTGAVVLANGPTITAANLDTPVTLIGTNITGTALGLTAGSTLTNANLTGPISSIGNVTSITAQTGTGTTFVVQNSPTLITPNIGAATGTNLSLSGQFTSTVATGTPPLVIASTTLVPNLYVAHAVLADNATSSGTTLQQAYNNSTSPQIVLTSALGGLQIQDNATPLGANLFSVAKNGGTTYFDVAATAAGTALLGINNNGPTHTLDVLLPSDNSLFIDARTNVRTTTDGTLAINQTAGISSTTAINLDINSAAFADSAGVNINWASGALAVPSQNNALQVSVNGTNSTNGIVNGLDVETPALGGLLSVNALRAGPNVNPISQLTGPFVNTDQSWYFNSVAVSFTSITTGSNTIFLNNNDIVYIGRTASIFSATVIVITAPAGRSIAPTFQYWNGTAWTVFIPTDGTSGFQKTGNISFTASSLTGWVTTSVNGVSAFYIRITRTRVAASTNPTESAIQLTTGALFRWTAAGDIISNSITTTTNVVAGTNVTTPLVIGGTTASSTLTLESTSGVGTSDSIIFKTGSQVTALNIGTSGLSTFTGNIAFTNTATQGIVGTAVVNNAATGNVGEYQSNSTTSVSPVTLPTVTAVNITSISLTPGDWDVTGTFGYTGSATGVVSILGAISLNTASFTGTVIGDTQFTTTGPPGSGGPTPAGTFATADFFATIPNVRIVTATNPTVVFLVGRVDHSAGVAQGYGRISARRVR